MKKPNDVTPAVDLPELTSLEWHWLFNAAAGSFADQLRADIDNIDRIERQIRIHGEIVPNKMAVGLKADPEKRREDLERSRKIHAKLLQASLILSGHMENAHMEADAEAMADYFRKERWGKK